MLKRGAIFDMKQKFICVEFVKDIDEIPLKFNLLKKAPLSVIDWYVRKFNPYRIEEISVLGESGYLVSIPITLEESRKDKEKTMMITSKMLENIKELSVDIAFPPRNFPFEFPEVVRIANGKHIFALLIMQAINKAVKMTNRELKKTEILIIGGNETITNIVLENVYRHVNYLSLIFDENASDAEIEDYNKTAAYIFDDVGLNVRITKKNVDCLKSADIIINTSNERIPYDYYYKRGAIYFDLGMNKEKTRELMVKRGDILVITGLKIKVLEDENSDFSTGHVQNNTYRDEIFEAQFYIKIREYRTLLNRTYANNTYFFDMVRKINEILVEDNTDIVSFYQRERALTSVHFSKFLNI